MCEQLLTIQVFRKQPQNLLEHMLSNVHYTKMNSPLNIYLKLKAKTKNFNCVTLPAFPGDDEKM